MSFPSKNILPEVGSNSFNIVLPAVDFPQPDSPTNPSVSPLFISKLTSSTAFTSAIVLLKKPPLML